MATASLKSSGKRWIVIFPLLLAGACAWFLVQELRYDSRAIRTTATVTGWKSQYLLGYRGVAEAKVRFHDTELDHRIGTTLWRRLTPGQQIAVVVDVMTSEYGRIDSFWQRFADSTLFLVIALGWLVKIWRPWRKKAGGTGTSVQTPQGAADAERGL